MSTIVCLGDSMTYGKGFGANSSLQKPLNVRLAEKYPGVYVVNMGTNGIYTSTMDSVKNNANAYAPFRVVVFGGINDITYGDRSAAAIEANLQSIYTYYSSLNYEVWALTITPCDGDTSTHNTRKYAVNEWIKNTATGVDKVIDAWTVIRDPSDITKRLPAYASIEAAAPAHFNDAGWAAIIATIS